MQALVTQPGVAHSTRVAETPEPAGDGVLLRVLEVGVCGTDREISDGLFGVAAADDAVLVLGHEVLAVVERDGHGFTRGDLVTATVRRSCRHCVACAEGSPDSCLTGDYSERGITRLDGFARELVVEDPTQVIAVPPSLGRLGVLAEPTSVCARALRHARAIGGRQPWQLERALVIGAGAVGMLSTLLLRLHGVEVWTASLEPSNELVEGVGAHYVADRRRRRVPAGARRLRPRDRGGGERAADGRHASACCAEAASRACSASTRASRRSSSTGRRSRSTRSSRTASSSAASTPSGRTGSRASPRSTEARARWPDVLESFVGLRVPLDRFAEAFAFRGGKATLVLQD